MARRSGAHGRKDFTEGRKIPVRGGGVRTQKHHLQLFWSSFFTWFEGVRTQKNITCNPMNVQIGCK
jgi:hypothetical protein